MYGYPKTIQTRHDIDLLMGYLGSEWATPDNIERGLNYLRGLIDNRFAYFFDRHLDNGESPDGQEPDYRVMTDDETGVISQYRLQDNPDAWIYRLGLTVTEVEGMISQIEGAA